MRQCLNLFFDCNIYDDSCVVNVYEDENGDNWIFSFNIYGKYCEETYYEMAYEHVYDNNVDFNYLRDCKNNNQEAYTFY